MDIKRNDGIQKMGKYIYGEKNGIHIIDLQKTVDKLKEACEFLQSILKGETVLFVGIKNRHRM